MSKRNICDYAKRAKMRMMNNSYLASSGTIDTEKCLASFLSNHKTAKTTIQTKKDTTINEDAMFKKVCEILDSGNLSNPVSLLIDRDVFNSLDREAKQFYIYNLTQKFNYFKNKYFETHFKKYII